MSISHNDRLMPTVFSMNGTMWLIRGLGILGIAASVLSFQCRTHKGIMLFKSVNELFFALQYLLLGAYTGCAMNSIGLLRNLLFARQVEKGRPVWPFLLLFSGLIALLGIFTWQGPLSLLVLFAKLLSTCSYSMSRPSRLRLLAFPTSISWLVYNLFIGSYEGALCETLTLVSIVTAFFRLDLPEYRQKNNAAAAKPEDSPEPLGTVPENGLN